MPAAFGLLLLLAAVSVDSYAFAAASEPGHPLLSHRVLTQSGGSTPPPSGSAPLRLSGGSSLQEGRVEVQIGGKWGTICADGFTAREARVVCFRLGLTGGSPRRGFGRGALPNMLSGLQCKGDEQALSACQFRLTQTCRSGEAAGVACNRAVVRAVALADNTWGGFDGSSSNLAGRGRLQVLLSGAKSGTVCGRGFGDAEAEVVCRMLGRIGGRAVGGAAYGPGRGPIMLADVRCTGKESNLTQCRYSTDPAGCDHSMDASVECGDAPEVPVRLASSTGEEGLNLGRLEVQIGGKWGTVCSRGFSSGAAATVCSKLGMRGGSLIRGAAFGSTALPIMLSELKCSGMEKELSACAFSIAAASAGRRCTHEQDAGVRCNPARFESFAFAENNDEPATRRGYLTAVLDTPTVATRGTMCRDGWTNREAQVACRSLGFRGGQLLPGPPPAYVRGLPMAATNLACKGGEPSLSDCTYDMFAPGGRCRAGAAGVACWGSRFSSTNTGSPVPSASQSPATAAPAT